MRCYVSKSVYIYKGIKHSSGAYFDGLKKIYIPDIIIDNSIVEYTALSMNTTGLISMQKQFSLDGMIFFTIEQLL